MDKTEIFESKPFKPTPLRSIFAKTNNWGQVPKNCVDFSFKSFGGKQKHCCCFRDNEYIEKDCIVVGGDFCNEYRCGRGL